MPHTSRDRPLPCLYGERRGLSTGWYPEHRVDLRASVKHAARFSAQVVELSALSARNLPGLCDYLTSSAGARQLAQFEHVTVHAPAKHLPYDWGKMTEALRTLPHAVVAGMVMHPDTFPDSELERLRSLGARLIVENMDCRKADCRTTEEMRRVFDLLPDAGWCFDVAHAWTIDPAFGEGLRMIDTFADRLVQLHVSGIDSDGKHRPTTDADLDRYAPLLQRCAHVPWIYESPYVGS